MRNSLFLVAALFSVAGCIEQAESEGSVAVALTATDADGATYRLTPGARLALYGGSYYDEFSLDGDGVVRIDVPAGDFTAELIHDDGHTTQWPLERTDLDGTTTTVIATLVTPMPALLTVPPDGQVNLVLQFQVPGFGGITFDQGTVEVSIDVAETSAGGVDTDVRGAFTIDGVLTHANTPPVLLTRMPALGDTLDVAMVATVTGAWYQASSISACAPASISEFGGPHQGYEDLIQESLDPNNTSICVFATTPPQLQIFNFRFGEATTATFSDLGMTNWSFLSYMLADLPASVFDGDTLDLDPVAGEFTVPARVYARSMARPPGMPGEVWYRGMGGSDTATLRIVLTP
jgi:hypothetical protein